MRGRRWWRPGRTLPRRAAPGGASSQPRTQPARCHVAGAPASLRFQLSWGSSIIPCPFCGFQVERELARVQAELEARDRALAAAAEAAERERAAAQALQDQKDRALAEVEAEAARLREQLQKEQEMPQCNVVTAPFDGMGGLLQALFMGGLFAGGTKQLQLPPEALAASNAGGQQLAPSGGSAASLLAAAAAAAEKSGGKVGGSGALEGSAAAGGATTAPPPASEAAARVGVVA